MADRQQFLDRINHADLMTARLQQRFHDCNREFFTTTDNRCVDAVRALAQQTDTVQYLLQLRKLQVNAGFQSIELKARLRGCEPLQQLAEDAFGVADIRQSVLTTDGFFNHRHQMVSDLRRCREHGCNLSLLRIAFQNVSDAKKTFRIRYRGPAEFQHSHNINSPEFKPKKKPALFRCGLVFCFSCMRQPAPLPEVMVVVIIVVFRLILRI